MHDKKKCVLYGATWESELCEMPTAVSPAPFRAIQRLKTKLYANESSMLVEAVGFSQTVESGDHGDALLCEERDGGGVRDQNTGGHCNLHTVCILLNVAVRWKRRAAEYQLLARIADNVDFMCLCEHCEVVVKIPQCFKIKDRLLQWTRGENLVDQKQ